MTSTRITPRDDQILELLGRARWLTTDQLRAKFFPSKSANAVNKRMRILVDDGLLRSVRPGMTAQCWFRLGSAGVVRLENKGSAVAVPRRLPVQLTHFKSTNDVRLSLESEIKSCTFLAEWE